MIRSIAKKSGASSEGVKRGLHVASTPKVDTGYLTVKNKLEKRDDYKRPHANYFRLQDDAMVLSDHAKLKEKYFSKLLANPHSKLKMWFKMRLVRDSDQLQPLMHIVATSMLGFDYGAWHVALEIGEENDQHSMCNNVVLEWNDSSVVIPYEVGPGTKSDDEVRQSCHFLQHSSIDLLSTSSVAVAPQPPQPQGDVYPTTDHVRSDGECRTTLAVGLDTEMREDVVDLSQQLDQVQSTVTKEKTIDKITKVVIEYNTDHYYTLLGRNCQTFANDVMTAAHISLDVKERMRHYVATLMADTPIFMFKDHESLDSYVECIVEKGELAVYKSEQIKFLEDEYERLHKIEMKAFSSVNWKCPHPKCKQTLIVMEEQKRSSRMKNSRRARSSWKNKAT